LARELARLRTVSAEKDSALAQVRETQDVIDAISRELSSIPGVDNRRIVVGGSENQPANLQAIIAEKITRARALVEQSDATIREREQRITALLGENDSLKTEAAKFRESIETMLAMIDKQRAELERLTTRVAELENAQEQLKRENSELSDTVGALRARENAVYVAVGTESELLRAGVIVRAGGANMGFWRPGQTLIPAKNPPRNAFRSLDMTQVRQIELPDAASYRIISNHNPAFLSRSWGDLVRGQLEIRDADRFWEASRFLILVRAD
jgi:exonuclease VII small subunit